MKLCFLNRRYLKWFIDTDVEKVNFQFTSQKRDTDRPLGQENWGAISLGLNCAIRKVIWIVQM